MFLAAMGCGAETPAENEEPLAQEVGASAELLPALVFMFSGSTMLLDGGITGSFPARFQLTELPPPAPDVLERIPTDDPRLESPPHAVAAIAAVARDRVPFPFPEPLSWSWRCGETREQGCVGRARLCGVDRLDCAKVEIHCDILDKNCTVTALSGNLALLRSAQRQLEGRVTEHLLLYVADDVPARSLLSQQYGGGAALAKGYHLLQRRAVGAEDLARRDRCDEEAWRVLVARYGKALGRSFDEAFDLTEHLILTRYNARHGTAHTSIEAFRNSDDPRYHQVHEEVSKELEREMVFENIAQQCLQHVAPLTLVGAPGSRELSMTLAPPFPKVGDFFPDGPPFDGERAPLDWPWF